MKETDELSVIIEGVYKYGVNLCYLVVRKGSGHVWALHRPKDQILLSRNSSISTVLK